MKRSKEREAGVRGGGGLVMRDECNINISYSSTGNTHACGFKAHGEASDGARSFQVAAAT